MCAKPQVPVASAGRAGGRHPLMFFFFDSHLWVKPKTQPALHLGMNLNDLTARLHM